jgi:hypothetical protein
VSVWRDGFDCVWRENGVWLASDSGAPELVRPDHFCRVGDREVHFHADYLRPFANRFANAVRSVDPEAIIFLEGVPGEGVLPWGPDDAPDVVHAPHWYDSVTLYLKRFIPWVGLDRRTMKLVRGSKRVQQVFIEQVAELKRQSEEDMGGVPTLIGEFGIPFDLGKRSAYRTGRFSRHVQALDRCFQAMEANLLNCTLWNYTADNTNERGDQWNGEDLSVFCRDQQQDAEDIHSGGRALEAAVRPYPRAVAGEPLRLAFDVKRRVFELVFRHDPEVRAPTEIFVPNLHYPQGYIVETSDGVFEVDRDAQALVYYHTQEREVHEIRIRA